MYKHNNPQKFVEDVVKKFDLSHIDLTLLGELNEILYIKLADRIIATILNSFSKEDFDKLSSMLSTDVNLSTEDAVMSIAEGIDGLEGKVNKSVDDLFQILTQDIEEMDGVLKNIK